MSDPRKGPVILELDQTPLPDAPSPAEAPPVHVEPAAARAIAVAARPSGWGLGRLILSALGALVLFWAGIAATDFVTSLFDRNGWLGWIGAALLGFLVLLLVAACLREVAALARLGRIETLRTAAEAAQETGSSTEAQKAIRGLTGLYARRADMEWALENFQKGQADAPDPTGQLALAERTLMKPLDAQAEDAVRKAARNVAAATALIPLALADVLAALTCNLRMIREISEIYGGRTGWIGSWRLMRAVAAHLVATGAVAVADDLLGPLVGGGVLGKLSRRFGEGAVNGALTARVGVATTEICRPLPFVELERPKASSLLFTALQGWRQDTRDTNGVS
ncbi:MAG: TIGR01620 family protein [Paracoccaceae bacterium]